MANETRQVRFGYAEQTDFDVAEADGATFDEPTVEMLTIDPDVMIHELPQNHGSFNPVEQNTVHSVIGSAPTFPINGPLDVNDIDQFLYAHTQRVIELADTEFTKTFTYFLTHPDFSADEGHFLTWIKRIPVSAGTSQKVSGCICPRIKLSGERNGMIMFESDWIGHGNSDDASVPNGTWTPRDGTGIVYFNQAATATITQGAGLTSPIGISMKGFEIESVWEPEALGHNASLGFDNFGIKNRSGTFKINLLRDTYADEAMKSLKAGEMIQVSLDFGKVTIDVTGKIEGIEYDDEGLLAESITAKMLATYSVGVWGEPLTIVIENTIDRAWPAA